MIGYNVYRSTTSGSGYTLQNVALVTDPEFTDNTVSNYMLYYYVVTAVDSDSLESVKKILDEVPGVESYSFRILFGGMLSDFKETTNIKIAALDPEREKRVIPLLEGRIKQGKMLAPGEIILPDLIK